MKQIYFILIFLAAFLVMPTTAKYIEVFAEPECQHNNEIVVVFASESSAIIKSQKDYGFGAGNDCNITVSAGEIKGGHVLLSIRNVDFDDPSSCHNYIEIFNGSAFMDKICGNFNYKTSINYFTIPSAKMIQFHYHTANSSSTHSGFEIIATACTDGPCEGIFKLHCNNNKCISPSLICDGYNNCGDQSDETKCSRLQWGKDGAIVFIVLLAIILVACVFICYHLERRRQYTEISGSLLDTQDMRPTSVFPVFK